MLYFLGGIVYSKLSHKDLVRHIDEYGVVLKGGVFMLCERIENKNLIWHL